MVLFKSNDLSQVEEDNSNSKLLGGSLYDTKLAVSKDHNSLAPSLLKTDGRKVQTKRIPSRIDYKLLQLLLYVRAEISKTSLTL
jgi:hypothetical protein